MHRFLTIFLRSAAVVLIFSATCVLFSIAVAFVTYRVPASGHRVLFEGDIEARKLDLSKRTLFEAVLGNGMVPLNTHTELYLPKKGNPWIGLNQPVYRVTVSASPLLFGGYADAKLLKVVRVGGR